LIEKLERDHLPSVCCQFSDHRNLRQHKPSKLTPGRKQLASISAAGSQGQNSDRDACLSLQISEAGSPRTSKHFADTDTAICDAQESFLQRLSRVGKSPDSFPGEPHCVYSFFRLNPGTYNLVMTVPGAESRWTAQTKLSAVMNWNSGLNTYFHNKLWWTSPFFFLLSDYNKCQLK